MNTKDKTLQIVRAKGPLLPVHIAKELNTNILLASAILSELVSNNQLKLTHLKIGGSPLYYFAGQEWKLQQYANKLHEKEKKIYDVLSQKKILRDDDLDLLNKVTLRQIKDYAKPIEVTVNGRTEVFWKWYLLSDMKAKDIINNIIQPVKNEKKFEEIAKVKEKKGVEGGNIKKEKKIEEKNNFLDNIKNFCKKNNIEIIHQEIIKKGKEADLILKVPSAVGLISYYCKAKNKKRLSDGDLSSAYVKGQLKKLPVLFLTTGELTKKAKDILTKDFNIQIKKI